MFVSGGFYNKIDHSSEMNCYYCWYITSLLVFCYFSWQNHVSCISQCYTWDIFLILVTPRYYCTAVWSLFHKTVHQHRYEFGKQLNKYMWKTISCVYFTKTCLTHILAYVWDIFLILVPARYRYTVLCVRYSSYSITAQLWVYISTKTTSNGNSKLKTLIVYRFVISLSHIKWKYLQLLYNVRLKRSSFMNSRMLQFLKSSFLFSERIHILYKL